MRIAAMLAAAAVGCSAPAPGPADALPITTVRDEPPPGEPASDPKPTPLASAPQQDPYQPVPTRLSVSGAAVTSSYADSDGAVYSTGTFVGRIVVEGRRLSSKGGEDVFVAKWAPDGSLVWVLAVGSPEKESTPRVTSVDSGRVHVVGLTEGRMDCGSGPLPIWSSGDTFFVCSFRALDGAWLAAGTFPVGAP